MFCAFWVLDIFDMAENLESGKIMIVSILLVLICGIL